MILRIIEKSSRKITSDTPNAIRKMKIKVDDIRKMFAMIKIILRFNKSERTLENKIIITKGRKDKNEVNERKIGLWVSIVINQIIMNCTIEPPKSEVT